MVNYSKYFTLYEITEPPPIITEGYKKVQDNYKQYLYTTSENIEDNPIKDDIKENDIIEDNSIETLTPSFNSNEFNSSNVVNLARSFVGGKYSWGGTTPRTGFDCSGLIQYVYKQNGINLPRTAKEMERIGKEVSLDDVQVGDIICTPGSGKSGKHVKMVSKIVNGQIYTIEAKGKKEGIIETPLTNTSNITTIRRVLNQKSNNFIIDYFVNKGLTINQAKGIYGNLMQESGGNIRAISKDGNKSYGLAQWTGERKDKLFSMYGNNPTAKQQLDFLWWELNNTHKDALEALRRTTTTSDATRVFMDKFERPHKDWANFNRRLKYANSII